MSFQWIYNCRSSFAFHTAFAYFTFCRLINDFMLLFYTHTRQFVTFQLKVVSWSLIRAPINPFVRSWWNSTTVPYVNICIAKVSQSVSISLSVFVSLNNSEHVRTAKERRRRRGSKSLLMILSVSRRRLRGVLIRVDSRLQLPCPALSCSLLDPVLLPGRPAVHSLSRSNLRVWSFFEPPSILELVYQRSSYGLCYLDVH